MNILPLSDLHLEFRHYDVDLRNIDVVILAGDIHLGVEGVKWANGLGKPVVYVPGNHEYYGHIFPDLLDEMKAVAKKQVHVTNREVVTIGGVNFLGSTLWTDFNLFHKRGPAYLAYCTEMADYRKISTGRLPNVFHPGYSELEHRKALAWLESELTNRIGEINVVVTHHAPSLRSIINYYRNDILTAAFASNLDKFIRLHQPKLWVHGHTHTGADYKIKETRVICNPRGYPHENTGFRRRVIKI